MGAGKSIGKLLTRTERASTPPAEDPTTTKSPEVVFSFSTSLMEISPI
jgi:hypothetical protein